MAKHEFEIHAGRSYYDFGLADGLRDAGAKVDIPAEGLGMVELGAFYSGKDVIPKRKTQDGGRTVSSYQPLRSHLEQISGASVQLAFSDVEQILGRSLPSSARNYRAWWANDKSYSHASSWLEAGWEVDAVNLTAEHVMFRRQH